MSRNVNWYFLMEPSQKGHVVYFCGKMPDDATDSSIISAVPTPHRSSNLIILKRMMIGNVLYILKNDVFHLQPEIWSFDCPWWPKEEHWAF